MFSADGRALGFRYSCACGRRFNPANRRLGHARAVLAAAGPRLTEGPACGVPGELWPEDVVTQFSKVGVVPVGTPVLHRPAATFAGEFADLVPLSERMLRTMKLASGIGLAANQVGAGVRVLVHGMEQCAPQVLVNPVIVGVRGRAERPEGCLSLKVVGSGGEVSRPREVTAVARLLDGNYVALEADEMLARVLLHEVDHLDGIEYVQRMDGPVRDRVYRALVAAGAPVEWLPHVGTGQALESDGGTA